MTEDRLKDLLNSAFPEEVRPDPRGPEKVLARTTRREKSSRIRAIGRPWGRDMLAAAAAVVAAVAIPVGLVTLSPPKVGEPANRTEASVDLEAAVGACRGDAPETEHDGSSAVFGAGYLTVNGEQVRHMDPFPGDVFLPGKDARLCLFSRQAADEDNFLMTVVQPGADLAPIASSSSGARGVLYEGERDGQAVYVLVVKIASGPDDDEQWWDASTNERRYREWVSDGAVRSWGGSANVPYLTAVFTRASPAPSGTLVGFEATDEVARTWLPERIEIDVADARTLPDPEEKVFDLHKGDPE